MDNYPQGDASFVSRKGFDAMSFVVVLQHQTANRKKKYETNEVINYFKKRCVIVDDASRTSYISQQ